MTRNERGAVSIFIVVFTALMVTVVTASFIQIMIRSQEQATNNDLSQSAYDSALAGVEDAKRALVALKKCEVDPALALDVSCSNLRTKLVNNGDQCDILGQVGVSTFDGNGEVQVGNDAALNQAYTCVKIKVNTTSYAGFLDKDKSVTIPLKNNGSPNDIDAVRISWFVRADFPDTTVVPPNPYSVGVGLPAATNWPVYRPPIMRSQVIQFNAGKLMLDSFDAPGTTNSNTIFNYPQAGGITGSPTQLDFASDGRRATAGVAASPSAVGCVTDYSFNGGSNGGYACSVEIKLTKPSGFNRAVDTRQAYLQLSSLYNQAHYEVQLKGGSPSGVIEFSNVQPEVDSTGRASNLFRRVRANVALSESGFPLQPPQGELYIGGNLCKDFFITNDVANYSANPACNP